MKNARAKNDILWELSRSAMSLGYQAAVLPQQPTIEKHAQAFERWRNALSEAHRELEIFTHEADDCRNCGRRNATIPLHDNYTDADLEYNKVCSDDCLQEMGEAYDEAHSGW